MDTEQRQEGEETPQDVQVELSTMPEAQVLEPSEVLAPQASKRSQDSPCCRISAVVFSILLMGAGGVLIGYGIYHSKIWTRTMNTACYKSVEFMYSCSDAKASYVLPYCDDVVVNATCRTATCKDLCPDSNASPIVPANLDVSQVEKTCSGPYPVYMTAAETTWKACSEAQIKSIVVSSNTPIYKAKYTDHGYLYSQCKYEIQKDPKAADVEESVKMVVLLIGCAGLKLLPSLIVCVSVFSILLWLPYLAFGVLLIIARILIEDICKEFRNSVCTTSSDIKISGLNCDINVACQGVDSVCGIAKNFFLTIGIPYAAAGIIVFFYQYFCCSCCSGSAFSSGGASSTKKQKDVEKGFDDFEAPLEEEGEDPADPVVSAELAVLDHGDGAVEYSRGEAGGAAYAGEALPDYEEATSHKHTGVTGNTEDKNVANTQGEAEAESPKEPEPLEGALNSIGEFWKQIEELTGLRPKSEGQTSNSSANSGS
ncbi:hypothetical protein GUITHDRAFT_100587 [Guillardia theta CCMP2712]|uniref:Uncharacterized protein n=1 Tax=Guillardia theta (strain CCMP2712) TaxID=905079 RepID=L1JZQ3_GUITC|nr:hypothetical protein GUITHDRAFT_100587 [Guillardia theta CCMP2712]EKX53603.1 hypothetical protein GUITHDRAFT_100587 [Guillardia theta CCMP2712]|eukprot:XP_005840583.1 hypothetical protein GUITHDRAFT_100587 [Guillardia theta CCMP2712]